ncbi:MAG TPA: peptidoglycan recognition family protein [Pseudonocardiaceae bacterium]
MRSISRTVTRRALLGGLAATPLLLVPGVAHAARPRRDALEIISCDTWGARPPSEPITVLNQRPTALIIHHTATANSTDYSREHAYALARAIQNHHMDTNGWIDTGQQLTITRGGYVLEGRHESLNALRSGTKHVVGAHASGYNTVAIGIENEGTYTSVAPPAALWESLVTTCAYICATYGLSPSAIVGHRDVNATACPGDVLYSKLPQLREEVAARIG